MDHSLSNHLRSLNNALLKLNATGEKGFEGLVGVALATITGVPFRLAGSGRQFGIDGKSSYDDDCICFEAKLYKGKIARTEVIAKIPDLVRNHPHVDLVWVLGSTTAINTQLADDLRADGRKWGVIVLILDWSKNELPPLATALALAGMLVETFLIANLNDSDIRQDVSSALIAISKHENFNTHAKRIQTELNAPAMATYLAQKANELWLSKIFKDKAFAHAQLGQPLSPGDASVARTLLPRKTFSDRLKLLFTCPSDAKITVVLGNEGSGKSWIVAQSWLSLPRKPIMLVLTPQEFREDTAQNEIDKLLIDNIINQTSDEPTDSNVKRWRHRFSRWRHNSTIDPPRFVVLIDGINQRPKVDWGRLVLKISAYLDQIGGHLIITSRTRYFRDHVQQRLTAPLIEINLPEWTPTERNEILSGYGINPAFLHSEVSSMLCNPRLLGIALSILKPEDVTGFKELSVSRLLFEHIRAREQDSLLPQPAHEFVRRLQNHARSIFNRVKQNQRDDLLIFEADTPAVADGRFFHAVEGEPEKYELRDDGLTLALGFAVVYQLRSAKRNEYDLHSALAILLDPISALDHTFNVVLAALTVTTVDDAQYDSNITAALVIGFAGLQNPDQSKYSAFVGLFKIRPQGFLDATRELCLADIHKPNLDWIQSAVMEAANDIRAWPEIANKVRSWLSEYSQSPELRMKSHFENNAAGIVESERDANRANIDEKLKSLSAIEQDILNRLQQSDGNLNALSSFSMLILADKPLTSFAESLVNWSFGNALNSDHGAPRKEFCDLISLNLVDWRSTRIALLAASEGLRDHNISQTGKWTLATILHATGDSDDADHARSLVEELTKNITRPAWRLVEEYCASDPCDPDSLEPNNIKNTAAKYELIDVTKLRQSLGQSLEDHFFVDARPGMVRFQPEIAIKKYHELSENIISRVGLPLRQGLVELREHNALLTSTQAHTLVDRWRQIRTTEIFNELSQQDRWLVSQYMLLIAFPLLSTSARAEILLMIEENEPIFADLMYTLRPIDIELFDSLLDDACRNNDHHRQYLLLAIAKSTDTPLSNKAREYITSLVDSDAKLLREQALGIIAVRRDIQMLKALAQSGWKAAELSIERDNEAWYGSAALLEAAAKGLIDHRDALFRISPRLYGRAAVTLDSEAAREIVRRIDASIEHATGRHRNLMAPEIEIEVQQNGDFEPSRFRVGEKTTQAQQIRLLVNSAQDFDDRQKRNHDAFIKFEKELTKSKSLIILNKFHIDEFAAIVTADKDIFDKWYRIFIDLPDANLPAIHNLIVLTAHALSAKEPDKAIALFEKIRNSKPVVRFIYGQAGVDLDAMATWKGTKNTVLDQRRFNRLDRAKNDHELASEVLAGLVNRQQETLVRYIEERLNSEVPAEIARGLMVAGFSDVSTFNSGSP